MTPRYNSSLGNGRFVQIVEWQGELRVDIREWENGKPTKKGVSLSLMQYKNLTAGMDLNVSQAFTQDDGNVSYRANRDDSFHLGANVFLKVTKDNPCVDIRQYWKPPNQDNPVHTKKGLCLRPAEYKLLKDCLPDIRKNLPELENVIPCYMRDDHNNQLGMLRCNYCNPHDYFKW